MGQIELITLFLYFTDRANQGWIGSYLPTCLAKESSGILFFCNYAESWFFVFSFNSCFSDLFLK